VTVSEERSREGSCKFKESSLARRGVGVYHLSVGRSETENEIGNQRVLIKGESAEAARVELMTEKVD